MTPATLKAPTRRTEMTKSSFYHDGARDAKQQEDPSPPDVPVYAAEYMAGWRDECAAQKAARDRGEESIDRS